MAEDRGYVDKSIILADWEKVLAYSEVVNFAKVHGFELEDDKDDENVVFFKKNGKYYGFVMWRITGMGTGIVIDPDKHPGFDSQDEAWNIHYKQKFDYSEAVMNRLF